MMNLAKPLEDVAAVFYLEDADIEVLNRANLDALDLLCSGTTTFEQGNALSKVCQNTHDAIMTTLGENSHREGVAVAMVEVAHYWACEYERLVSEQVGDLDATQKQTPRDINLKLQG